MLFSKTKFQKLLNNNEKIYFFHYTSFWEPTSSNYYFTHIFLWEIKNRVSSWIVKYKNNNYRELIRNAIKILCEIQENNWKIIQWKNWCSDYIGIWFLFTEYDKIFKTNYFNYNDECISMESLKKYIDSNSFALKEEIWKVFQSNDSKGYRYCDYFKANWFANEFYYKWKSESELNLTPTNKNILKKSLIFKVEMFLGLIKKVKENTLKVPYRFMTSREKCIIACNKFKELWESVWWWLSAWKWLWLLIAWGIVGWWSHYLKNAPEFLLIFLQNIWK